MFFSRFLIGVLALLATGFCLRAGMVDYAEAGKTDFDTAMPALNPYGTWSKIDEKWAYTPLDHYVPYTAGRWLYTEYGWTWSGTRPESWLTEHYGYWKRSTDKVWSWFPGPFWLPQTVELRESGNYIGWRSGEVDADGSFVEPPEQRHAKPDEWSFVTRDQFARPITPAVIASADAAVNLLDDSTLSGHTYLTYREIARVGPHPADFLVQGDGGMFPPLSLQDRYELEHAAALAKSAAPPKLAPIPTTNAPSSAVSESRQNSNPAAGAAPAGMVAAPTAAASPAAVATSASTNAAPADPEASDARQVRYWIAMDLPTLWAKAPPDAKARELYLYRPDFFQDNDGITRRITLWLNPASRNTETTSLASLLSSASSISSTNSATATPAPVSRDPFHEEFDDPKPKSK